MIFKILWPESVVSLTSFSGSTSCLTASSCEIYSQESCLKPFLDASCPKGASSDWNSPRTSFLYHQKCSFKLMSQGLPVQAALATDSWVYWNWAAGFQFTSVWVLGFAWLHIQRQTPALKHPWLPTRCAELGPAVTSCLFKQDLPRAKPGCGGETLC